MRIFISLKMSSTLSKENLAALPIDIRSLPSQKSVSWAQLTESQASVQKFVTASKLEPVLRKARLSKEQLTDTLLKIDAK